MTRPARYFANPVFAIKFALLIAAIGLSAVLVRLPLGAFVWNRPSSVIVERRSAHYASAGIAYRF